MLQEWRKEAEKVISCHINEAVSMFEKRFRNISQLLSPIINTAYKMQSGHGNVNLKATGTKKSGIWMATVALNAQTAIFHSEEDCTYTMVNVPHQSKVMNFCNIHQRIFLIKINDDTTVALPFNHNLSFFFSRTFLIHCQHCNEECNTDGSLFYNIVCYGNKKITATCNNHF